jgi:hypothetical protein
MSVVTGYENMMTYFRGCRDHEVRVPLPLSLSPSQPFHHLSARFIEDNDIESREHFLGFQQAVVSQWSL